MAGGFDSPVFDFSSLDFESVRADLTRYAQQTYPAELWTDFNESNFGTFLLELMAYATDLAAYNLNASVLETVPVLVRREQNFRNLGKTFDYALDSATPSAGTTTITDLTTFPPNYTFVLSAHTKFTTDDGVVFQPIADFPVDTSTMAPGDPINVPLIQGDEVYQEVLGVSTGKPNQFYALSEANVIDGTIVMVVGALTYELIDNFISAGPTDTVYVVETSEAGITTITFGDGINGRIPPASQNLLATYKTGGGLETNFAGGTSLSIVGTSDGSPVSTYLSTAVCVFDADGATGGGPKQSLAAAKMELPLSLKANDRAITTQDYASEALNLVPGALKARGVNGAAVGGQRPILLFVVPNGGGDPSAVLASQIVVALKDVRSAGKRIRVVAPVYVNLLITANEHCKPSAFQLVVSGRLRSLLLSKYALETVDFGSFFGLQDLYDSTTPSLVSGSQSILFSRFTVEPYAARHVNVPTSGNGDVESITTDPAVVQRREWYIKVIAPVGVGVAVNQFEVWQRRLGTATLVVGGLMTDERANYVPNELVGMLLHPNPEESATTFTVTANTGTTITAGGNQLPLSLEPDDPYVVESLEPVLGKILRTRLTANAVATNVLTVASTTSFTVGDKVIVKDSASAELVTSEVTAIGGPASITILDNVTANIGDTLDFLWESPDGVRFSLIDAADILPTPPASPTAFVVGDSLYVDTYPTVGDLQLRAENYPVLETANLVINVSGGTRLWPSRRRFSFSRGSRSVLRVTLSSGPSRSRPYEAC
jgi:hypothetical protein